MNPDFPPGDLVIGTVTAPFKAVDDESHQWLETAEWLVRDARKVGFGKIHFFAAAEVDVRGYGVYSKMQERLDEIHDPGNSVLSERWTFSMDDNSNDIDAINRLLRICTGRNMIHEFALQRKPVSHALLLDSDIKPDSDAISKLIEVDAYVVGGDVPVYCLGGQDIYDYPFPVQAHMNTAGFLLVRRDVLRGVRWRNDVHDSGSTDDPCFHMDVENAGFGGTLVRKDVKGHHKPLVGLKKRGHDLKVYR